MNKQARTSRAGAIVVILGTFALLGFVIGALVSCGAPPTPASAPDVTVTVPATVGGVGTLPAATAATAERGTSSVVVAQEAPPFDPVAYVNGLPYAVLDMAPVHEAYRIVAAARGWGIATIDKWEPFIVDDVIRGESVGCWNVRGGATMAGVGCEISHQGTHSDSGFFQLVSLWYQPSGPACVNDGYCSADSITASPYASMDAGLFAVEWAGSRSWCFAAWAISFHPGCNDITRTWP